MQKSISVIAFVLFMSPLGIAISPIAVSCVKFLTGLAKNDVYLTMGSNDGAKKNLFSKIP